MRENNIELINTQREKEKDLINLKETNRKYNEDYNNLCNKMNELQNELNELKKENQSLLNNNKSLSNNNEIMLKERQYNNEIIFSYKETIDKLKREISQLKVENEKYKKENIELKNKLESGKNKNLNRSNNSGYEDEIIIVNKETTYSKGLPGKQNEYSKYGEIKNKYDIKKNEDVNTNEILKLHDIIQDLSNMILIYEKFFFKEKVKPKNNHELFCYLIVQYINEKFKKIKANVFMNLLIYKNNKPRVRYIKNNNTNFLETKYGNIVSGFSDKGGKKKINYFNEKINNNEE